MRKPRTVEENTFDSLLNRLSRAGFKQDFVRSAILPDWWDDRCKQEPRIVQDIEMRIARFLGLPLTSITNTRSALKPLTYPQAHLRQVREIHRDKLGPSIHSAMRIASAVIRNLRSAPLPSVPPSNGLAWRRLFQPTNRAVTLLDIAGDLWNRGIPVIPLDLLPSPSFQGIAGIVLDRPVVMLGHKYDEPGRAAFVVAHEAGHIAAGDCAVNQPVVDEDESISDNSPIERRADQYANLVIIGRDSIPTIEGDTFKDLARNAIEIERQTGADASGVTFAWARRTRASNPHAYALATLAIKALYRSTGARRQLRQLFDLHVDTERAADTDRALLRCVYGEPESD